MSNDMKQQQNTLPYQGLRIQYQGELWEVWAVHPDGSITAFRCSDQRKPRFVRIQSKGLIKR